jgi:hypothetical protein
MPTYRRPKQPHIGRRQRVTHAVARLVKRHYGWVLAVLGLLIGVVSLYLTLNQEKPITAEQQELLSTIPPKVAWHCRPTTVDLDSSAPDYVRFIEATATCESVDPGPEEVNFVSFTTDFDFQRYMQSVKAELTGQGWDCEGVYSLVNDWVDADGRQRGEVICIDGEETVSLLWSDRADRLVGSATSRLEDKDKLQAWWQRVVKNNGHGVSGLKREYLISLLPSGFGACEQDELIAPPALASVDCEPGRGITSAGAYLFDSKVALGEYLDSLASAYPGATDEGCEVSTYSYAPWGSGPDGKPTLGKLFCYVTEGVQWYVWTTNRWRVFAYASREDENAGRLFDEWAQRFNYIGKNGRAV